MEPDSLVQLVGSGNTSVIEEEWVQLLDSPEVSPVKMVGYDVVLSALRKREKVEQAESLAWTAIEALVDRYSPTEALPMAGSFLLAIGDSQTLRGQVTNLYRSAFPDVEGLDALLTEAGIAEGRPVRRALRTLDVCLAIDQGDYLVARHEDGAARVESITRTDWSFTINLGRETEELGAVYLADSYRPAPADDFRVMRCFAREELWAKLQKEPTSVVIELCRLRDNKIDSLEIERMLVPVVIAGPDWNKWWTKARSALKKCRNMAVEGRSPYYLTYREEAESPGEAFLDDLKRINDPLKELARVERCISECAEAGKPLDESIAENAYDFLESRAKRIGKSAAAEAGLRWAVAARARTLLGFEGPPEGAARWLVDPKRFAPSFDLLETEPLISVMFECAVLAHGDDWQEQFVSILPHLTVSGCDFISTKLVDAGLGTADFEPVVEAILASPLDHFEALLWLWNGPSKSEIIEVPSLRTLINKILHTFEQSLRTEDVSQKRMRKAGSRARAVLSARRHARFKQCLDELEPGMAGALRRRMTRCDALGRAVREDLLRLLNDRFPPVVIANTEEPWEREEVLFVTAAGMKARRELIDHHVNVKMRKNSEAIGRAAEHGDLSENSEYKFALEERDLLRGRLAQMNEEFSQAEVIVVDAIPTDHVGIGCRVVLENAESGQPYEMMFVGPWEADLDKGLLNYKTPVAQKVLGKRVGDEVEFDHRGANGTFKIVEIINGLADSEF